MKPDLATLARTHTPKQGKPFALDRQVCVIRFSPDSKTLAAGDFEGKIRRLDVSGPGWKDLGSLAGHQGWVQSLVFHPDGKRLFSADSSGRIVAWPFTEKAPKPLWTKAGAHASWIKEIALSPDGKTLASCGLDNVARLWSADKGTLIRDYADHDAEVLAVAFAPDGQSVVTGDLFGRVHRWDVKTGKLLRAYDASATYKRDRIQDVGGVRCLGFDTKGETLAAGGCQPTTGGFVQGSGLILYFDATTGKLKSKLPIGNNNDGFVYELHWHKVGFVMAVTSGQPGQGKLLFHLPGDDKPFFITPKMANCHSLAVAPDGKRIVVAGTNTGSSGNGRLLNNKKEYPGNWSVLHPWDFPAG